jgi:hypothetical protein
LESITGSSSVLRNILREWLWDVFLIGYRQLRFDVA